MELGGKMVKGYGRSHGQVMYDVIFDKLCSMVNGYDQSLLGQY